MSKHTPTPWGVHEDGTDVIDDTGNIIVFTPVNLNPNEANAEFIVMACNIHGELVEKLKEVEHYMVNGTTALKSATLYKSIKELLAKAEVTP